MTHVARGKLAAALVVGLFWSGATVAFAGDSTPQERCAAAKMRAVGKSLQLRLGCIARGTVNIDVDVEMCLLKAQALLANAFAKAENGTCTTVGDAGDWELEVQDFVDTAELQLTP